MWLAFESGKVGQEMSPSSANEPRPTRLTVRGAGIRMTEQRLAIALVLAETDDEPDANEIFHRAFRKDPSISFATAYRTKRILELSGAIHRHAINDRRAPYEHASQEHHDRLIDIETGKVIEFRSDKIEQLHADIAREFGYDIVRHKLELYGVASKPKSQTGTMRPSRSDEATDTKAVPRVARGRRRRCGFGGRDVQ